jgi:hypothetical protein
MTTVGELNEKRSTRGGRPGDWGQKLAWVGVGGWWDDAMCRAVEGRDRRRIGGLANPVEKLGPRDATSIAVVTRRA